jgi:hypothetical protein
MTGAEELCRRAADANARRDAPDWRVEEVICAARQNIAFTTGAFADTDPGQARASLRESRELSTALGYQSAIDLLWATAIAFLVGDQAAVLELGRRAIHGLQRAATASGWASSSQLSLMCRR